MTRIFNPFFGAILVSSAFGSTVHAQLRDSESKQIESLRTVMEKQHEELREFREEVRAQNGEQHNLWTRYAAPVLPPLATILAAAAGAFITIKVMNANFSNQELVREKERKIEEACRHEDQRHSDSARIECRLIDALKLLGGSAEEKYLGLAFVETYWGTYPTLHPIWRATLITQAGAHLRTTCNRGVDMDALEWAALIRTAALLKTACSSSRLTEEEKLGLRTLLTKLGDFGVWLPWMPTAGKHALNELFDLVMSGVRG